MYRYYYTAKNSNGIPNFPADPCPANVFDYAAPLDTCKGEVLGYAEYSEPLPDSEIAAHLLVQGDIPTYGAISEDYARRHKEAISWDNYKEGSETSGYRRACDAAGVLACQHKRKIDPMYHNKVDSLFASYCRKLAENKNDMNRIGASCPSIMISGGSNFPVAKKRKQNAAMDRKMEEWQEINNILSKIKSVGRGGISSDDPNAIEKLRAKLDGLEKAQKMMKAVNAYYRKHKTVEGCPDISEEMAREIAADMKTGFHFEDKPFASYALSNNNQNIRNVKARIEALEKRESAPVPEGISFDGGRVEINTEIKRLMILFDGIPAPEIRTELKSNGFRWSPKNKAWQRQYNENAVRAMRRLSFIAA